MKKIIQWLQTESRVMKVSTIIKKLWTKSKSLVEVNEMMQTARTTFESNLRPKQPRRCHHTLSTWPTWVGQRPFKGSMGWGIIECSIGYILGIGFFQTRWKLHRVPLLLQLIKGWASLCNKYQTLTNRVEYNVSPSVFPYPSNYLQ